MAKKLKPRLITYNGRQYSLLELENKVLLNFSSYSERYGYGKSRANKDYQGLLELLEEINKDPKAYFTSSGVQFGTQWGEERGSFGKARSESKHYKRPTWMLLDTLRLMTPYEDESNVSTTLSRKGIQDAVKARLVPNWNTLSTAQRNIALKEALTQARDSFNWDAAEDEYSLEPGFTSAYYKKLFDDALIALGTPESDDDLFRIYGTFGLSLPTMESQLVGIQNEYVTGIQAQTGCTREEAIQMFNASILPRLLEKYNNDFLKKHKLEPNTTSQTTASQPTTSQTDTTLSTTSQPVSSVNTIQQSVQGPSLINQDTQVVGNKTDTPTLQNDKQKLNEPDPDSGKKQTPPPEQLPLGYFKTKSEGSKAAKPGEQFIVKDANGEDIWYVKLNNGKIMRITDSTDKAKYKLVRRKPIKAMNGTTLKYIKKYGKGSSIQADNDDEETVVIVDDDSEESNSKLRQTISDLRTYSDYLIGAGAGTGFIPKFNPITKALLLGGYGLRAGSTILNQAMMPGSDINDWIRIAGPVTGDLLSAYLYGRKGGGFRRVPKGTEFAAAQKELAAKLQALATAKTAQLQTEELAALQLEKSLLETYLRDSNTLGKLNSARAAVRKGTATEEQLAFLSDFTAKQAKNRQLRTLILDKTTQLNNQQLVNIQQLEQEAQASQQNLDNIAQDIETRAKDLSIFSPKNPYNVTGSDLTARVVSPIAQGAGYGLAMLLSDNEDLQNAYFDRMIIGALPSVTTGLGSLWGPKGTATAAAAIPMLFNPTQATAAPYLQSPQLPDGSEYADYDFSGTGIPELGTVIRMNDGRDHIVQGLYVPGVGRIIMQDDGTNAVYGPSEQDDPNETPMWLDQFGEWHDANLYGATIYGDKSKIGQNRRHMINQLENGLVGIMAAPVLAGGAADYVAAQGATSLAARLAKGIKPFIPLELMNQADLIKPIIEQLGKRPVVEVSPGITEILETSVIPGGPLEYFSQLRQL